LIPGTKRRKYPEENAGAASLLRTPQEVRKLEAVFGRKSLGIVTQRE